MTSCPDCVPPAPFDFEGLTGNECMQHSGWPGHCRCEYGYMAHNEGCPKARVATSSDRKPTAPEGER